MRAEVGEEGVGHLSSAADGEDGRGGDAVAKGDETGDNGVGDIGVVGDWVRRWTGCTIYRRGSGVLEHCRHGVRLEMGLS